MKQCMRCKEEFDTNASPMVEVRCEELCVDFFKQQYYYDVRCNNCQLIFDSSYNDFVEVNDIVYCLDCAIGEFEVEN